MRRMAFCVCIAVLGAMSVVRAQDQAFGRGIDAREDGRWPDVVNQMTLAIQASSQESDRKVGRNLLGLGGTEYVPYFFLGEAYFKQEECALALEAWERSEAQKVITKLPEYMKVITAGKAACEARGVLSSARLQEERASAQKQYEEARTLSGRIDARAQANPGLWRNDMREALERGNAEVRNSFSRLQTGTTSRSLRDFTEARAAAERARNILNGVDSALSAAIESNRTIQQQAADIEKILASAEELDRDVESKKALWAPSHAAGIREGREALERGRERLNTASRSANAALLTDARKLASDASTRLKTVLDDLLRIERLELERAISEQLAAAHEVFSFVEGGFVTFNEFITDKPELLTPEVTDERAAIERDVAAARRRLDAARKTENLAGVREAARLASSARDRLTALIETFGPLTLTQRGVHVVLQEGARLFFQGQYQQALTALEPADGFGPDVPLQLHAHLFRAASLYALFVRSSESDAALRARAIEEVQRCRQLNPEMVPDERFSPRFVAFFQSVPAAAASPSAAASQQP